MRKIIFIMFLLCLSNKIAGQTQQETQDWIIKTFTEYRYTNSIINENLYFNDGYLYKKTNSTVFRVKIKNIKKVKIEHEKSNSKDKEGWVMLAVHLNIGSFEYKKQNDTSFKISNSDPKIDFFLVTDFMKDNMKERMEKAIVHLVKLYGGTATIYKEPF